MQLQFGCVAKKDIKRLKADENRIMNAPGTSVAKFIQMNYYSKTRNEPRENW